MPEHVHLLIFPQDTFCSIDAKAIKRPFSYRIKRLLTETGSPFAAIDVRQRPGVSVFRFGRRVPGPETSISLEATSAATTCSILILSGHEWSNVRVDWR